MAVNANLYAHFRDRFPADSNAPLLIAEDGRIVTYAEADAAAARLASALLSSGLSPAARVTVQVEKSVENLLLYLACLRAGLIYHPLNTAYTSAELEYFLKDAAPSLVVCDPAFVERVENAWSACGEGEGEGEGEGDGDGDREPPLLLTLDAQGQGSLMELAATATPDSHVASCAGDDVAALLYSSGTTGRPKGIMLTHDNLRKNVETLVDVWGFTPSDRLLHALPIYHVHGLFVAVGCVLMSGSSMVWHARFTDTAAIAALADCTVMMGVPTYYTRMLGNPDLGTADCVGMRLFISGSAPLLSATFKDFQARTGHTILERYGMTETGMNTSNPLHGERRPGTVGPALPGVTVRVVDDDGNPVAKGEVGHLQVRGANVFAGYWKMPEKTAEDFTSDGFFNTGDTACIDADGYLSIIGRAKDLIITGGLNVYPREIEQVIDALPGVTESAVIGVPDADLGEIVVAVIVPQGQPPTDLDVIEHCRGQLARFKTPRRVEFCEALPRNAMGKVQKNQLRDDYAG